MLRKARKIEAGKTVRLAAIALPLALAGCVPTMEMAQGEEQARLAGIVERFRAAETSADPKDSAALLTPSLRDRLARSDGSPGGAHLTSIDPRAGCAPGKVWYRGGSRMLAEVRLATRSDRLDIWRGSYPEIVDVLYGKPKRLSRGTARSLSEALRLEQAHGPPAPPEPILPCGPNPYHFAFLATDTQVYRQGATVKLTPRVDQSPGGTPEIPLDCTSGWTIAGPGRLSADRSSVTIDDDAPVGAAIAIGFDHHGKRVEGRFQVIGKDAVVLTGSWSQRSIEGCSMAQKVGELAFTPGNGFSVTFNPFESYRDYWGRYSFDPATGQIQLSVEGGNFVPHGLDLEGTAERAPGGLVLRGLFLGSRGGPPQRDCTYRF